ncbi:hypothetical protein ISS30_11165 [bacterium]|nr:hypothetical protein [bacterium]
MWCHAFPHDTKILFILCMVSTAESRHHNELNLIFKVNILQSYRRDDYVTIQEFRGSLAGTAPDN